MRFVSDMGSGMVLTRSYLFINFLLLIFFSKEARFDQCWEFEALLKCLCKQNRVRVWSEIGYQILGQV